MLFLKRSVVCLVLLIRSGGVGISGLFLRPVGLIGGEWELCFYHSLWVVSEKRRKVVDLVY